MSPSNRSTPDGQPSLLQPPQPTEVLTVTSVDKDRPIQHAGTRNRLAARVLDLRVHDQALAGLTVLAVLAET